MTKRTRYFVFGSVTVLLVGLCTGLVAYYTGMPMGAFGQSSGLSELRYVPASASVVAYADVRNLMQSELRQKLHKAIDEDGEDGQAEFQKQTGIDIEHDIDRVVAFMEPLEGAEGYTGMVLATGRFDQGRLEALAREHGGPGRGLRRQAAHLQGRPQHRARRAQEHDGGVFGDRRRRRRRDRGHQARHRPPGRAERD